MPEKNTGQKWSLEHSRAQVRTVAGNGHSRQHPPSLLVQQDTMALHWLSVAPELWEFLKANLCCLCYTGAA